MESNETFNAEQNEIEYKDAMTEQSATVQRLAAEFADANAKVAELTDTCNQLAEKLMQE